MSEEPKQLGKCIRCDKAIVSLEPAMPANPNGAMMGAVAGHYGSIHDLSTATVFVCDECVIVAGLDLVQSNPWSFVATTDAMQQSIARTIEGH